MMWPIARHVDASAVVYDCMDELSAFRFAPPDLAAHENALMSAADVVFTGGHSIFEAKAAWLQPSSAAPAANVTA